MDGGVTINRPPRDGRMAFVRIPDNISVELLQKGAALAPAEPWASMPNTGNGDAARSSPVPAFTDNYSGWSTTRPAARQRWSTPAMPRRCWPQPSAAAGRSASAGTRTGTPITPAATWRSRTRPARRSPGPAAADIAGRDVALSRRRRGPPRRPCRPRDRSPRPYARPRRFGLRRRRIAFVGDTLFAMGCGRLFEGTPEQMYRSRSQRHRRRCPTTPRSIAAHEYTLANARFAAHAEPDNATIAAAPRRGRGAARRRARSRFRRGRSRNARPTRSFAPPTVAGVRAPALRQRQVSFMKRSADCDGGRDCKEVKDA